MTCKNCGSALVKGANFCTACGCKVEFEAQAEAILHNNGAPTPETTYTPPLYTAPTPQQIPTQKQLPEEYKPLSPLAYWGYKLLFSLPIAGFICIIIFSLIDSNINRRNFARSFWCDYILSTIIFVISLFFNQFLKFCILSPYCFTIATISSGKYFKATVCI